LVTAFFVPIRMGRKFNENSGRGTPGHETPGHRTPLHGKQVMRSSDNDHPGGAHA